MNDTNGWSFPDDLLEAAWGIIANAHGGNWDEASDEWRLAAEGWRNAYHRHLGVARLGDPHE